MAKCDVCGAVIPPDAAACPVCLQAVAAPAASQDDEAYELSVDATDIPAEWQGGAVYALELPARCPFCRELIQTVRVLRLRRTQVTITSTLPRGGRAVVCPECNRILSAELATL